MGEMKAFTKAIIGFISVGTMLGCSVQVKINEKNETDMGTHHVVVKPHSTFTSSSSTSSDVSRVYQYSVGKVSITIRNDELIVNNTKYGKLAEGEPILVDNGKVLVAGLPRQGTPMSPEETVASAEVKETTQELAGYQVTVRPGASFTAKTEVFGRHTLSVGDTKVSIKKDGLSVNDTSYGVLNHGDTVLVENSKVFVSGTAREIAK
jgi:hypothetical protein